MEESTFPGTVVPPPAPTRRDSPPSARAAAIPIGRGTLTLTQPAYPSSGGTSWPSPRRVIRRNHPKPTVQTRFYMDTCGFARMRGKGEGMSRHNGGTHGETRSSALWGSGGRGGGGLRANALWGKGGRGFVAILAVLAVTAIPLAGASHNPPTGATYVDPWLLAKA